MRLSLRVHCGLVLALSLLWAAGCSFSGGGSPVTVTGKVTRGGQPIKMSPTQTLRVILQQDVPPGRNFARCPTKAEPDGSFTVENVPMGRYKVVIHLMDQTTRKDVLEDAFSIKNTPFVMEIDGKKPLEIDLARTGG